MRELSMRRCSTAILIFVATVVGTLGTAGASVELGPITNPANGHHYYRLSPNSWTGAETEATSLGGHLVTVNDLAENDWLVETFASFNNLYWIGLNDADVEGEFRWVSGESASFRNWYSNEPQAPDYVVILTDFTRQWLTRPDTDLRRGFVEVVPEPASLVLVAGSLVVLAGRRSRSESKPADAADRRGR